MCLEKIEELFVITMLAHTYSCYTVQNTFENTYRNFSHDKGLTIPTMSYVIVTINTI